MASGLVIHGFETSNNFKVRVGLGYKGIDYEFHAIEPTDRARVIRLSGQQLTPVMVHDGRVLFDSGAILRYLDANFPDTPSLFGTGHAEQWPIEEWERFGRGALAAGMMKVVHHRITGGEEDPELRAEGRSMFQSALARLDHRLADREWLFGGRLTAADVTCAPVVHRVRASGIFDDLDVSDTLRDWTGRVMAHDRHAA